VFQSYFRYSLPVQDSNREDLVLYVSLGDYPNSVVVLKADYYQPPQMVENMASVPGAELVADPQLEVQVMKDLLAVPLLLVVKMTVVKL
jgi:hypothetical protein